MNYKVFNSFKNDFQLLKAIHINTNTNIDQFKSVILLPYFSFFHCLFVIDIGILTTITF